MKEQEVQDLVEYLRGEGPPLVITGSRGCGKTTLLKLLADRLKQETALCVTVSPEEDSRQMMDDGLAEAAQRGMRRVLQGEGIGHHFLHSESLFRGATLPAVALDRGRLFLLVDGLDYVLSRHIFDASFLPLDIPPSMRLVVAVASGPLAQALAARGWRVHQVRPLETEEQRRLIRSKLAARQEVEEGLLAWRHGGHPQHLLMATALARETDQAPACEDEVATVVERLLGTHPLRSEYAAFLALAEHGLPPRAVRETGELLAMMRGEPLLVMRRHLFVPATTEVADVLRAQCGPEQQRAAHRGIAEAYGNTEGVEFYAEAAAHLTAIADYPALATLLTRLEVFQSLVNYNRMALARYWRSSPIRDGAERYQRMLDEALPHLGVEARVALLNNLGLFAEEMGWLDSSKRYLRQVTAEAKQAFPPTHNKVGITLANLANLLKHDASAQAEVEALYQEMLATLDGPDPVDKGYPKRWGVLRCYAEVFEEGSPARDEEGLALREKGIAAARAEMGAHHPMVGYELMEASQAMRWLWPKRALGFAEEAQEIMHAALGPWDDKTLRASRLVAAAQLALGRLDEAERTLHQVLAIGQEQAARIPREALLTLEQLVELADCRDQRAEALRLREEQYAVYCRRPEFGPGHADSLGAGENLGLRYEAAGCFDKALEMDERLAEGYARLEGPEGPNVLNLQNAIVRVLWRMGRRRDAEARLATWEPVIERCESEWTRSVAMWLRSEWALEDGRRDRARDLVERALPQAQTDALGQWWGWLHVVAGGHFFRTGDLEMSARYHEAGAGLIVDRQNHLGEFALRAYQAGVREPCGRATERSAELSARLRINANSPRLDRRRLPAQGVRAAWNPVDGRTLAVLDKSGQTHLFAWHGESAQLERLDPPFAQRELPKDLVAITLRWSSSGSALRFVTPDADETIGVPAKNDPWVPASTVSPDGRTVAYLGTRSISLIEAPQ